MAISITLKIPFKEQQRINTEAVRKEMINAGMTQLSPNEISETLSTLGFYIHKDCTFDYYNTGNPEHYLARSISINDIKRKISFAHCDFGVCNEENNRRQQLQKFRYHHFGWDGTRIWDL